MHQGVLVEWTDTNPSNNSFEGTAREIFRVWLNTRSHQLGEVIFNQTARPGDADWRVLYVDVGDGASGESKNPAVRPNPQRLDTMVGKIVRIIPDLNEHAKTSTVSENGRYRIPNDNPFVKTPGARKEIWAYGLRNPHRLTFAVDPSNAANNRLVASICGLNTWEMITIIHKGANYGFPLREGNQAVRLDNTTMPLRPTTGFCFGQRYGDGWYDHPDLCVVIWWHDERGGDCAGSGYLFNGKTVPALRGSSSTTTSTTGRIWYSDYKEMLAADDGNPQTMAKMYEVKIASDDPADSEGQRVDDTDDADRALDVRSRGSKAGKHERAVEGVRHTARRRAPHGRSSRRDVCG